VPVPTLYLAAANSCPRRRSACTLGDPIDFVSMPLPIKHGTELALEVA
jgi:hypothetical protein